VKLVNVNDASKEKLEGFVRAFELMGETTIPGGSCIENAEDLGAWLAQCRLNEWEETVAIGLVPAMVYVAVDDEDEIVGIANLRLRLNEFLLNFGGHIGYSIHPQKRGQGYGREMLKYVLKCARDFSIDEVLITCDDDNFGSQKVIEANGGVLENVVQNEDVKTCRYWIR